MKTIVYIDGFNLYYRRLRSYPEYRWLNLKALSELILGPQSNIVAVKYYTARVSGKIDPDDPKLQNAYLRALKTVPEISIHYGSFQITDKWSGLIHPPEFRPPKILPNPWPDVVRVRKIEEKGSDVNLGVHLVRDGFKGDFEAAVILSNDTDLVEPIRIVKEELNFPIGLITPVSQPAGNLKKYSNFVKHIRNDHLKKSQFPHTISCQRKDIVRPEKWR